MNTPTQEQLAPTVAEVLARFPRTSEQERGGRVFIHRETPLDIIERAFPFALIEEAVSDSGVMQGHLVQCIPPQEDVEQWDDETRAYWLNGKRI